MSEHAPVTVISKDKLRESNSSYAQGGIAAVISPRDGFERHVMDTLKVGQGLCNRQAVELMVRMGPGEIRWLMDQGVAFDSIDGELDLSREGGHSKRRVVHAGDITGDEVQKVLVERAREHPEITLHEDMTAIDLVTENGVCKGVTVLDNGSNTVHRYQSDYTVLATGGVGQIFSKTSNPEIATGDGVAMAWRAGAEVTDMEFTQFHPSILDKGEPPYFLISETVRGEGGVLVNSHGDAFMVRYHALSDLAPRDVVSRAIVEEQKKGQVYIDIRHRGSSYIKARFPRIYAECLRHGVRMDEDLIPVSPAAHYMCGGVKTSLTAETSIKGLLAVGECAATGVHGANRLASNSTLECMTFAHNAVNKLSETLKGKGTVKTWETGTHEKSLDNIEARATLQETMWTHAGINRSIHGVQTCLEKINQHRLEHLQGASVSRNSIELRNLFDVAGLVARSAYTRRESRGTHSLEDYPLKDDVNWLKHVVITGDNVKLVKHE